MDEKRSMDEGLQRALAVLGRNLSAYEQEEDRLEQEHRGKFAVFHDSSLIGVFKTTEDANAAGDEVAGPGEFAVFKIGREHLWPAWA